MMNIIQITDQVGLAFQVPSIKAKNKNPTSEIFLTKYIRYTAHNTAPKKQAPVDMIDKVLRHIGRAGT